MSGLRSKIAQLAEAHPELRSHLVPLLKSAAECKDPGNKTRSEGKGKGKTKGDGEGPVGDPKKAWNKQSFGIAKKLVHIEYTGPQGFKINPEMTLTHEAAPGQVLNFVEGFADQFSYVCKSLIQNLVRMGLDPIGSGWKDVPAHFFRVTGSGPGKILVFMNKGQDAFRLTSKTPFDMADVNSLLRGEFRGWRIDIQK